MANRPIPPSSLRFLTMSPEDLEKPMGNAELRLAFASVETKIEEVHKVATDTKEQATKTNGAVGRAFHEIEVAKKKASDDLDKVQKGNDLEIQALKTWRTSLAVGGSAIMVIVVPILALSLYKLWNTSPTTVPITLSPQQLQILSNNLEAAAKAGVDNGFTQNLEVQQ